MRLSLRNLIGHEAQLRQRDQRGSYAFLCSPVTTYRVGRKPDMLWRVANFATVCGRTADGVKYLH